MKPWSHLPRHRATTAQAAALFPGIAPPPDAEGPAVLGYDVLGAGCFRFDPFDWYGAGLASNPNLCVFGEPGAGKSSAVKTMLHRWVGLERDRRPRRWAAVCDPKGEYRPLAEHLGLEVIALRPGGAARLNPLDRHVDGVHSDGGVRRAWLLAALGACLLRRDLRPIEDAALGWAVDIIGEELEPTVADVVRLLSHPTAEMAARAASDAAALRGSVEDLRLALEKLLDRELRGMFDGRSTIDPARCASGVVVDLSAVHGDRDALAIVMVAATAWLQGTLARRDGTQRIQVVDEAWALLANPAAVRHLQASWKLCRDYGVANIAVAHRISDLRGQADDGTALAKVAAGLLADTETRVLFRQPPDQIAEARSQLGLTPVQADLLPRLARGRALWKRPGGCALVQHVVAPSEWPMCDTDGALLGRQEIFCDDLARSAKFRQERAS